MENIVFKDKSELQQYVSQHFVKKLGLGREGVCSLLDNGMVMKCLYENYYPDFALQFKDVDVPSFIFARSGAYIGEFVVALFMDYAPGLSLYDQKPYDQSLVVLGQQLEVLVNDIKTISKMGIWAKDFHGGNTIYDSTMFRVVDTLPYLYLSKGDYTIENLREIMMRLYDCLLEDLMKYREVSSNCTYLGHLDRLENPKQYLIDLKARIEFIAEHEVVTLGDAKMALEKKLK